MPKKGEHFDVKKDVYHADIDVIVIHGDKGSVQYVDGKTTKFISYMKFCEWKLAGRDNG